MARITFSPLIAGISGKMADAVGANWKGRAYVRKRVIPHNPKTPAQTAVRESMARCVQLFRSLEAEVKDWLNTYAVPLRYSGYNQFTKLNRALEQADSILQPVPPNPYQPAPTNWAPVTGGVNEITVHWVDNSTLDFDKIYLSVREEGSNEFTGQTIAIDAAVGMHTFTNLTSLAEHQVYGAFFSSVKLTFGTAIGTPNITAG